MRTRVLSLAFFLAAISAALPSTASAQPANNSGVMWCVFDDYRYGQAHISHGALPRLRGNFGEINDLPSSTRAGNSQTGCR